MEITIIKKITIDPFDLTGKYVITNSNFTTTNARSFVLGVPLKVTTPVFKRCGQLCFWAVSMITGIQYLIPLKPEWMEFYDTYEEVVANSQRFIKKGYEIYDDEQLHLDQIVLKDYNPIDNSWAADFKGERFPVRDCKCLILSTPFKGDTWDEEVDLSKYRFILVRKEDGSVGRCLFMEHCL